MAKEQVTPEFLNNIGLTTPTQSPAIVIKPDDTDLIVAGMIAYGGDFTSSATRQEIQKATQNRKVIGYNSK